MAPTTASLHDLCINSVVQGGLWPKQRRSIHHLPEAAANEIIASLISSGKMDRPYQLQLFHFSGSKVSIPNTSPLASLMEQTMTYLCEFKYLSHLAVSDCARLKDSHLSNLRVLSSSLTSLQLTHCNGLTNACLQHMAPLTCLQTLNLSGCSGISSPLATHLLPPSITCLDVSGVAGFDDNSCSALLHLPALSKLVAWGTTVTSQGIQLAAFCEHLTYLDVSWTSIDLIPAFPQLLELHVRYCSLGGVLWPSGAPGPLCLTTLNLAHSRLTGSQDEVAQVLVCAARSLQQVDLAGVELRNLTWLHDCNKLQQLRLDGCQLARGLDLSYISAATQLQQLSLQGVDLGRLEEVEAEGAGTYWLLSLQHLKSLDLSQCNLDDRVLPVLWQLTALRRLVLDNNPRLTGQAPALDTLVPDAHITGGGRQPSWSNLAHLEELACAGTAVCDAAVIEIVQRCGHNTSQQGLSKLRAGGDALTDKALRLLSAAQHNMIRHLELQDCSTISARAATHLSGWPHLEELHLKACRLLVPTTASGVLLASESLLVLHIDAAVLRRDDASAKSWSSQQPAPAASMAIPNKSRSKRVPSAPRPSSGSRQGKSPPSFSPGATQGRWASAEPSPVQEGGSLWRQLVDQRVRYTRDEMMTLQEVRDTAGAGLGLPSDQPSWWANAQELGLIREE